MDSRRRRAWPSLIVSVALACGAAGAAGAADSASPAPPPADASALYPKLAHSPLPGPLVLTGSFGEHRNSHLHAGLDLSTGGQVGMEVFAPEDGRIERVRSSGAGYGRSIYIRARDGRLLVLAHLDAYDEPIASFMDSVQNVNGVYEQDVWIDGARFPVRAGQRVAWSGRSGTGSPHLHFEIRRGDMALQPLRAGLDVRDAAPPELRALTLEPLDGRSFVQRGAAPLTRAFGARRETLVVEGRVRAIVSAVDPGERRASMEPWGVGIEWRGMSCEWRADSISWATDLPDIDYVYDFARAAPWTKTELRLWAAPGARPHTIVTSVPDSAAAGVIEVEPGAAPRPLLVYARDLAGHVTRREVWLRGPRDSERGPNPVAAGGPAARRASWRFEGLPNGTLRVSYAPALAGTRAVHIGGQAASWRGGAWHAVLTPPAGSWKLIAGGERASGGPWSDSALVWVTDLASANAGPDSLGRIEGGAGAAFERGPIVVTSADTLSGLPSELLRLSRVTTFAPVRWPLRSGVTFVSPPLGAARPERVIALYREGVDGWEYLGDRKDASGERRLGDARRLGRFALFVDTEAPRIATREPAAAAPKGPYPTWALVAGLTEDGSGVDVKESYFVVDGRRVPSEWDGVRGELRWRPLVRPKSGSHRYQVIAADKAGNARRESGTFVLD